MTKADDPLEVVREWMDAVNGRNRVRSQRVWREDAVWRNRASGRRWNGPEAITTQLWSWLDACPDLRVELTDSFSSGSRGLVEVTWRGTQSRAIVTAGGTVAPTGRRLAWSTCYLVGTREGKLASLTDYYDAMSLLPPPASFPELARVEVRGDPGSPPVARGSLRRGYFPALATIDLTTSFPQLAGIRWEEGEDDGADILPFRPPIMATFPDLAKCRW
jgi:ketosteroid isomerase-like protein